MQNDHMLFVFGTLKRGFHNSDKLKTAVCVHETRAAEAAYDMISLRSKVDANLFCPGVRAGGTAFIAGELYRNVDELLLAKLDDLEGVASGRYARVLVKLADGNTAWIYIHSDCSEPHAPESNQVAYDAATNVFQWRLPGFVAAGRAVQPD